MKIFEKGNLCMKKILRRRFHGLFRELTILTLKAWSGWTVRVGIGGGLGTFFGLVGVGTIFLQLGRFRNYIQLL